jgi:uncharacterized delta-60 repeat protein
VSLPTWRRRGAVAALALVVAAALVVAGGPASAADGDLDPTFSGDGRVVSDFGADERADGVAVQPDGRVVVAGTGCGGDFLVARYDAGGGLDPTFDGDGRVCVDVGTGSADRGVDVLVLADGRLLVAGTSAGDFALVRLTAAGAVDPTFGAGGRATFDFGGTDELRDVALAPDGRVVMVGEASLAGCVGLPGPTPGQSVGAAVARALPDGAPDPSFAGDGTLVLSSENLRRRGLAVAVQPDGRVVVGGRTASCTAVVIDFFVLRLTAGGEPDPTFAPAYPAALSGPTSVADLAIQPDGKIVAVLDTFVGPATLPPRDDAFTVVRFNPDGSLDTSFDGDGVATALFGAGLNATPTSVVLQGDRITVGGSVDGNFALARFNADGTPDPSFAVGGIVVTDVGGSDAINALAVQPDGKLVAAGQSGTDLAVARYGTAAAPTTSTSTSTSSTSSTTSTSSTVVSPTTTVPVPTAGGLACPILAQVRSVFVASPLLSPFLSIIDSIRTSFGCA